ncbi:IclR family transcriptional regulator [Zhongshania sp. BJYM1]|uniref:IclR family transcriptional regulator n=1 Tax=Zhongshania aquatica TaxID=2965069 RepID=UPI0022B38301|nr:helix-turn-helix domain-containing protein [Marortus sp. BJYM1]
MFSKPTARALSILDLLMAHPQKSFGLTELTRTLNLNKATCHAILSTMITYGFLVQDEKNKQYRLGPSIVAAGNAAFAQFPVLEYARPELEKLTKELNIGCGVIGRSAKHLVLLANYGITNPLDFPFQLGLRLPNAGPLGAAFIAWSPAKNLEAWLQSAQLTDEFDEKLDQRLRIAVIGIRARGFEVTLKTRAEEALELALSEGRQNWSLEQQAQSTEHYREALCHEDYHLNRIEPEHRYAVCNIAVPVFGKGSEPELIFSTGSIRDTLSGRQINEIAARLETAAQNVTLAAHSAMGVDDIPTFSQGKTR